MSLQLFKISIKKEWFIMDLTTPGVRYELVREARDLIQKLDQKERRKYALIALKAIDVSPNSGTQSLTGAEATAALDAVLGAIREAAQALADRWSRRGWFFSLRCLPPPVWGHAENVMSHLERRSVAEALSALSHAQDTEDGWRPVPAPLLIRFAYCAQAYAAVQVARRVAARNISVHFPVSDFVYFDEESPLFRCLREQDQRRSLDPGEFTARFGTQITRAVSEQSLNWKWILMLSPRASYDPNEATTLIDGSTTNDFNYTFGGTGLSVSDTLLSHQWYDRMLPGALLLNRAVGSAFAENADQQRYALVFGAVRLDAVDDFLNEHLKPSGPWIDELSTLFPAEEFDTRYVSDFITAAAQVRPIGGNLRAGPLLHPGPGPATIVDLLALSIQIPQLLLPQDPPGRFSDLRARDFENVLQAVIDNSQWRPPDTLRALVRRSLEPSNGAPDGGRWLTDIDAIGHHAGKTLLVDAKSYVASGSLDGDYNSIRNIRTLLEDDIVAWRQKVSFLNANRVGRNYDLTSAGELVPCVITPSPHFVHENLLNDWAHPGLRAISSLAELQRFVSTD
jgi:hypothetical protein